ncbi:hypothetical protein [Mariprofundus sp. KV]|uniref:hypothetical protein n=1 Tax=Mariprofundus sp. KV TaxID=2608715 RepID=UPI0015A370BC|nr:hypothetical protein [Mariprofundus sp. KV]NWF35176.1 hypothetical protein [Mariprofundus sp. KV]
MLYLKGTVNSVSLKKPEGKKPFYNVQLRDENENGSIFTTWCKVYSDQKLNVGDELEIQVKVNAWDKGKFRLIGFIK